MIDELTTTAEQRLGELAERFKQWRATKTRRAEPIPESLWAEALELSELLPRRQVSRTLRLSDHDLQKRQGQGVAVPRQLMSETKTLHFVELNEAVLPHEPNPSTRAEMTFERPDGARLQLRYSGAVAELSPLVHSFLTLR